MRVLNYEDLYPPLGSLDFLCDITLPIRCIARVYAYFDLIFLFDN